MTFVDALYTVISITADGVDTNDSEDGVDMPMIRCSKEFHDWLLRRSMDTGNPASILLDRLMTGDAHQGKVAIKVVDKYPDGREVAGVEYIPKAQPAVVSDAGLRLKPWFQCRKCGERFHYWSGSRGAVAHRAEHSGNCTFKHLH